MNAVEQVIDVLERAERLGAKEDKPEGSRYILLSETLVELLISKLKQLERGTEIGVGECLDGGSATSLPTLPTKKSKRFTYEVIGDCYAPSKHQGTEVIP